MMNWIFITLGALAAAVVVVLLAVSFIERRQAYELAGLEAESPQVARPHTAVVYFSRSGNTALAARHLANRLGARLFALDASAYRLGPGGLVKALGDANALKSTPEALPDIVPRTLDLSPFDTLWLGSPVWLYSPAPPIWAFIEHNRFDGKEVVLFNTYNSHFGEEHIAALKAKVMARGAKSFSHRHVLRGRMTHQLPPEQMLAEIDKWFPKAEP
ncbi:flavodoxin family protein [Aeromonas hydrophila]|uniref:flavodoxin family protein n=1 Tax=Aeromonas hydrophila TaxID=644 RepID=UPI000AB06EDB|nr:flavodoxin [Aeromonas hydrophila]